MDIFLDDFLAGQRELISKYTSESPDVRDLVPPLRTKVEATLAALNFMVTAASPRTEAERANRVSQNNADLIRMERYDDMRRTALKALLNVPKEAQGRGLEELVYLHLRMMSGFSGPSLGPIGYTSFTARLTEQTSVLASQLADEYRRILQSVPVSVSSAS